MMPKPDLKYSFLIQCRALIGRHHILRARRLVVVTVAALLTCAGTAIRSQTPTLPEDYQKRVIAWLVFGGATNDDQFRRLPNELLDRGWHPYIRLQVKPLLQAGVRRIVISNPFGYRGGGPMQFDQLLDLREAARKLRQPFRLERVDTEFVDAWRPVTQGLYTDGEPVEVICYLGKLNGDKDFESLAPDAWRARFDASIKRSLDAGMSIGFDASSAIRPDTPEHKAIERVRDNGVPCYIEARPLRISAWQDWPVVSTESDWWITDKLPEKHFRTDELGGEIIRFVIHGNWEGTQERLDIVLAVLAEGHTVAMGDRDIWRAMQELQNRRQSIPQQPKSSS